MNKGSEIKQETQDIKKSVGGVHEEKKRETLLRGHHLYTSLKRWSRGVYERENKNETEIAGREKDYLSPLLTQWDDNAF